MTWEDEEIVGLYWDRSQDAIAATAQKYGARLEGIAIHIVDSAQDAEECANDTYLAAWNAIPPTRPSCLFAYLAKLVRNLALGRLERRKAEKRGGGLTRIYAELEECIAAPADDLYERGQIRLVIQTFLYTLDAEKRAVFVRRYWFADSIEELAGTFGMSESKVKSLLFRLRKRLKTCLEKEGIAV